MDDVHEKGRCGAPGIPLDSGRLDLALLVLGAAVLEAEHLEERLHLVGTMAPDWVGMGHRDRSALEMGRSPPLDDHLYRA